MGTPRSTVLPPALRADCQACVGLCCVALPFDAVQGFGFDKPAHTPCAHLCADDRCGIHDTLEPRGFRGCVVFDCQGAGQRVSQQLFAGRTWRDSPDTAREMFDAFGALRSLHELLALLHTASQHVDDARLVLQYDAIDTLCSQAPIAPAQVAEARQKTLALLAEPAIRPALAALRGR